MRTWNYKGTQSGYKTCIQRVDGGDIVIFQSSDNSTVPGQPGTAVVRFNERELRKILSDKKRFPGKKKSKRGKN